jgi:hypothetical protein
MKTSRTAAAAATAVIPLLLSSLTVSAGELPFNAPHTARAQENAQLLHQAAQALGNLPDQHIQNLWIFPTSDTNTVFARYDVKGESGVATQHLTVLKVDGSQIVEQTDLTAASAYAASGEERPNAVPHWSASIGTGHAADTHAASANRYRHRRVQYQRHTESTGRVDQKVGRRRCSLELENRHRPRHRVEHLKSMSLA